MKSKLFVFLLIISLFPLQLLHAETIKLVVPQFSDSPKQVQKYYSDLLKKAIVEAGHTPRFTVLDLPQLRAKHYLENGMISICWLMNAEKFKKKFIPVNVGITDGLIGKRVLLIKKGEQNKYDNVKTIDDFRELNLVGGFGNNWFDVDVWELNNLKYATQGGSWKSIFMKVAFGRDFNYFSRGINEVLAELKLYSGLELEKNLVFIYDRDFLYYLNANERKYQQLLTDILLKAKKSGLIKRMVKEYWKNDFDELHYDDRIKIYLKTP